MKQRKPWGFGFDGAMFIHRVGKRVLVFNTTQLLVCWDWEMPDFIMFLPHFWRIRFSFLPQLGSKKIFF
ncbi:Uncharacterized protein TCM_020584 [Theobroma cacao]|uniref:Uncharacterized protein n=1 Tax=Theobroma cacao TaxID=3641 RepID=A0A061ELB7_THECC|nr:Uncharacterized protein TCM_020584 [Theobroma cacao]